MFEIIYGESGTGKSTLLYKKIREEAVKGKKVFLFVPDQFSFEAEKIIYKTVEAPYGLNVTAAMFSRTSQKILKLAGENKPYADDIVKTVVMKRVISGHKFSYYEKQSVKDGFPKLMLGIIGRLRTEGISPSQFRNLVSEGSAGFSDALLNKLNDICEVYTEYDKALSLTFSDKLDDVRRAAEIALETDFFKDKVCFFDGFDDYSGSQMNFIGAVAAKAEKLIFTVTTDSPDSRDIKFFNSLRLIERLKDMSGGDISFIRLEEKFRNPEKPEIIKAKDLWQECDWICSKIHELIENGSRYRDIAVIMPDKAYGRILESSFKKYDIPAFIDIPSPLLDKSIVRFMVHTLRALSFETEDILRYMKSRFVRINKRIRIPESFQNKFAADGYKFVMEDGVSKKDKSKKYIIMEKLINLQDTDIDKLEQLCRRYDLKKNDWLREFPEGIEKGNGSFRELEDLRKEIIGPLTELAENMNNKNGREKTEALCDFIYNRMNLKSSVFALCRNGVDEKGKPVIDKQKQDEYSSLWDDVAEVMESLYEALKGEEISLSEYTELIAGIFASTNIANPPQYLDTVTVGDPERSRFTDKDYVFICGVNQGVFPKNNYTGVLFTSGETEILNERGISVENNRNYRFSAEQFIFYRSINIPKKKLFVTYSILDEEIRPIVKSRYIDDLCEMYGVKENGADNFDAAFYCRTEAAAKRYLSTVFSSKLKRDEKKALCAAVGGGGYEDILENGAKELSDRHKLSVEKAKAMLLKESYSPSALNKMNNCKFAYFCGYGLGISEELKREAGARATGDVVHFCLESLLKEYFKNNAFSFAEGEKKLAALTKDQLKAKIDGYIEFYTEDVLFGGFGGGERFSYQISRLSDIALYAAENVRKSIVESGFIPAEFEHELEFELGKIRIKGKCDRFDISVDGDDKFIRVVDYKRGKTGVPMENVYTGKDLQMFLYLFGLCEEIKANPSSVMYQPIGKPETKQAEGVDIAAQALETEISNAINHRLNGVIIKDTPEEKASEELDKKYTEKYGEKKDGYSSSLCISPEEYESLKKYCEAYVNAMIVETGSGMIGAIPKDKRSCDYCDFKFFCGHDDKKEDENGLE